MLIWLVVGVPRCGHDGATPYYWPHWYEVFSFYQVVTVEVLGRLCAELLVDVKNTYSVRTTCTWIGSKYSSLSRKRLYGGFLRHLLVYGGNLPQEALHIGSGRDQGSQTLYRRDTSYDRSPQGPYLPRVVFTGSMTQGLPFPGVQNTDRYGHHNVNPVKIRHKTLEFAARSLYRDVS